jgi:hypothetical protein
MPKYRKKPVVIEAIQWEGSQPSLVKVVKFLGYVPEGKAGVLVIPTLEGNHNVNVGDWIIKGVKGEFYPCKPDIFEQTYEAIGE